MTGSCPAYFFLISSLSGNVVQSGAYLVSVQISIAGRAYVVYTDSAQSLAEPQPLPRYQSALLLVPSKDEDSFTDIRLNDPVYSTRTEGEPNTFSHRTFLQVRSAPTLVQRLSACQVAQCHTTYSSGPVSTRHRHARCRWYTTGKEIFLMPLWTALPQVNTSVGRSG